MLWFAGGARCGWWRSTTFYLMDTDKRNEMKSSSLRVVASSHLKSGILDWCGSLIWQCNKMLTMWRTPPYNLLNVSLGSGGRQWLIGYIEALQSLGSSCLADDQLWSCAIELKRTDDTSIVIFIFNTAPRYKTFNLIVVIVLLLRREEKLWNGKIERDRWE